MRKPAAAGSFYPAYREELEKLVEECFNSAKKHTKAVSAYSGVSPHAGLIYSGVAAAVTFSSIKELAGAETVVVVGPNHTGVGGLVSLSTEDWELPVGVFKNDKAFGEEMVKNSNFLKVDESAHSMEHSIEVQLPFLRKVNPSAEIVPVCMMDQSLEGAMDVANAVIAAEEKLGRKVVVVASSDFSHYLPAEVAKKNDSEALGRILELDSAGFQKEVKKNNWSICGYGPITSAMLYAQKRGSKKGLELMYTNSGERSGDFGAVVGYASVVFPR